MNIFYFWHSVSTYSIRYYLYTNETEQRTLYRINIECQYRQRKHCDARIFWIFIVISVNKQKPFFIFVHINIIAHKLIPLLVIRIWTVALPHCRIWSKKKNYTTKTVTNLSSEKMVRLTIVWKNEIATQSINNRNERKPIKSNNRKTHQVLFVTKI